MQIEPFPKLNSASHRDQLLNELATLNSQDELAGWAVQTLSIKNNLKLADVRLLEDTFASKTADIWGADPDAIPAASLRVSDPAKVIIAPESEHKKSEALQKRRRSESTSIDKSALTIGEPKRLRDKAHLRFVASQPCLICARQPSDAHHLRFAQPRALGLKVSDEFTVPLCRTHHRQLHQAGNETAWWVDRGVNSLEFAKGLWEQSRGLSAAAL